MRLVHVLTEIFKTLSHGVHHVWGTPAKNDQQALKSSGGKDVEEVAELLRSHSDHLLA